MSKQLKAALLGLAVILTAASQTFASSGLLTGIEDERHLLDEPAVAPAMVDEWQKIGIDVVRLHANWARIAPTQPANQQDPNDPAYKFEALDNAVDLVTSRGMKVHLTITGPPRSWARTDTSRSSTRWKPSPKKFADFATATAKRYGSKVDTYMIWNEPNVDQWIQPQKVCKSNSSCRVGSPGLYRKIVRAAYPAIKSADPGAKVLIGELAPRGKADGSQMKPLAFLRSLGCVDSNYRSIKKGDCKNFKAAKADGFAYHPHPVKRKPDEENPDPDNAQLGDTKRLTKVLDKLSAHKRLRFTTGKANLYFTEFGYQTNPPDPVDGVSEKKQSRYLQQSDYIAYKNTRIKTLIHYQWFDAPLVKSASGNPYSEWQSGLFFNDRREKLALQTFRHPFWVQRTKGRKTAEFFGQVRPGGARTVTLQQEVGGSWQNVATINTSGLGFWAKRRKVSQTANYRYVYDNGSQISDTIKVKKTA